MSAACRRCSFSLIELVVVLVIIGIISGVAIPRFAHAAVRSRVQAAARRVMTDLNRLRRHAFQTSTKQAVVFDLTTHAYAMAGLSDPDKPGAYYIVSLADEPYQAEISAANFSGQAKCVFDGFGKPEVGGIVTVKIGEDSRSIIVNPDTGEAYLQ